MKVPARDTSTAAFTAALDALVPQLRSDRSILAAILGGSLSHDTRLGQVGHRPAARHGGRQARRVRRTSSLYADGVNVHALLMQRAEFRKLAEGAVHQSFMHSFLAKSRVLFTHDDTIADLCARLQAIGERDTHLALLEAGTHALPCIYKAHKFLDHPRRPRLHGALDPVRGDAAGAGRGHRRAQAGGSRGHPAGAGAQSRRSSRPSTPTC